MLQAGWCVLRKPLLGLIHDGVCTSGPVEDGVVEVDNVACVLAVSLV